MNCPACEAQKRPLVEVKSTGQVGHLINHCSGFYSVCVPNGPTIGGLYLEDVEFVKMEKSN